MSRFPVLATTSVLLKVSAALGVVGGFFIGLDRRTDEGNTDLVLVWVGTALFAIVLWVYAEIIDVFLAIEENTYDSRLTLQALARTALSDGTTRSDLSSIHRQQVDTAYQAQGNPNEILSGRVLKLTPDRAAPNSTIRAELIGFPRGSYVSINWHLSDGSRRFVAGKNAAIRGSTELYLLVPDYAPPGLNRLDASTARGP